MSVILPCLKIFFSGASYLFFVFIFVWLFGIVWGFVRR